MVSIVTKKRTTKEGEAINATLKQMALKTFGGGPKIIITPKVSNTHYAIVASATLADCVAIRLKYNGSVELRNFSKSLGFTSITDFESLEVAQSILL